MDHELDRGIAVRPTGPGEYAAHLDGGWVVGGGVNGGYLLAVLGQAVSTDLAASASGGAACCTSAGGRRRVPGGGGRPTTVAATLLQVHDGVEVERLTALAVFGDLGEPEHDVRREIPPVELPPLEDCVETRFAPEDVRRTAPLLERFGTRLDPACVGWAVGRPSGEGLIQGWFRLVDDRPLDPVALLLVVDALPPVTFDLGLPGWAPTLELTAHVRRRPAPGWARVRHATRTITGGYFEEDCEVWDSEGHLVAQSRQLALLPRPVDTPGVIL